MKNSIPMVSYARAQALMAAGCPIDFPENLPGYPTTRGKRFRVEQLFGYAESCVFALGPYRTAYVITLRLTTDRGSGTVITDWYFSPPWEDHQVGWDYEPSDVIPKNRLDAYQGLFTSRLRGVLDEHRLITRGRPVDGLLCGLASQAIGAVSERPAAAKLTLQDDAGNSVSLGISLPVDRSALRSQSRVFVGRHPEVSRLLNS